MNFEDLVREELETDDIDATIKDLKLRLDQVSLSAQSRKKLDVAQKQQIQQLTDQLKKASAAQQQKQDIGTRKKINVKRASGANSPNTVSMKTI